MNHRITRERRDWLLCLWFIQSLVPREEHPRKQSGMGHEWWGGLRSADSCFGPLQARFGLWDSLYLTSPQCKVTCSLWKHRLVSSFVVPSRIFSFTYYSQKGGQLHTEYILAVNNCSPLNLLAIPSFDGETIVQNVETQLDCCCFISQCMSVSKRDAERQKKVRQCQAGLSPSCINW